MGERQEKLQKFIALEMLFCVEEKSFFSQSVEKNAFMSSCVPEQNNFAETTVAKRVKSMHIIFDYACSHSHFSPADQTEGLLEDSVTDLIVVDGSCFSSSSLLVSYKIKAF